MTRKLQGLATVWAQGHIARMGWRFLQIIVATGFLFANVHWQWMSNPYMASANAICLAIAVTWMVQKSIDIRHYGLRATMPPANTIAKVSGAVVLAVVGGTAFATAMVFFEAWVKAH